jgi:hypothetical protein
VRAALAGAYEPCFGRAGVARPSVEQAQQHMRSQGPRRLVLGAMEVKEETAQFAQMRSRWSAPARHRQSDALGSCSASAKGRLILQGHFLPLLLHEHPSSACNTSTSRLPRSLATLGVGGQRGRLSISEKSRNAFVLFLILLKATLTSFAGLASISVVRDKLVVQRHVLTDAC